MIREITKVGLFVENRKDPRTPVADTTVVRGGIGTYDGWESESADEGRFSKPESVVARRGYESSISGGFGMSGEEFPQTAKKFEIQSYEAPTDFATIGKTHVAYTGSPHKHPHDPRKVILVIDPFSAGTPYFEFLAKDISYVEKLPSLVNHDGHTVTMARIWVKKKSIGVSCTPFRVEDVRMTETS